MPMVIAGDAAFHGTDSSAREILECEVQVALPSLFRNAVQRFANRLAVEDPQESLSYGDLDVRSTQLARAILDRDATPARPIILVIRQSAAFIVAALAALKAGKAYVPLEPSDPVPELLSITREVGRCLILCNRESEEAAQRLCHGGSALLSLDEAGRLPADPVEVNTAPDQLASIYFTSGTTGTPKGVLDTHRNIIHNARRYAITLKIRKRDRHSLIQSPSFSGTSSTIFSCLLNGASVFPFDLRRQGMARLVEWMNRKQITIWHSVPLLFEQALHNGLDGRTIRLVRAEGDQLHSRHVQLFQKHFTGKSILVNGLGTTETGLVRQFFVTTTSPIEEGPVPLGFSVPGMAVTIRRTDGTLAPAGEVGELQVHSEFLALGYWKRPDLTATKFEIDPRDPRLRIYRTGDLGLLRTDGCLESHGRKEFQAKVKGRMVDFSVIERALCQVAGVRQALVSSDEQTTKTQQLVAHVVAEASVTVTQLRKSISSSLPSWLVPAHYVFVDALPSDRHGKLIRSAPTARSADRPKLETPFEPPRTALQKHIARCFSDVLKVKSIGLYDNFFELGGDSLLAAALALEIDRRIERPLLPDAILDMPTVADISARLERAAEIPAAYALTSSHEGTPLFCVNVQSDQPSGFRTLAQHLGNQPIFVLRVSRPSVDVADMARQCIAAMRSVQSHGPYQICGNCFAGVVAFEMAQQLRQHHEEVSMLGLIDTAYPPRHANLTAQARVYRRSWRHLLARGQFRARLARAAVRLGLSRSHTWLDLYQTLRIAELQYKPQPYEGPTRLFIAGALGNQAGWSNVITRGLKIIQIADAKWDNEDDRPHLIAEPLVRQLASVLSAELDRPKIQ